MNLFIYFEAFWMSLYNLYVKNVEFSYIYRPRRVCGGDSLSVRFLLPGRNHNWDTIPTEKKLRRASGLAAKLDSLCATERYDTFEIRWKRMYEAKKKETQSAFYLSLVSFLSVCLFYPNQRLTSLWKRDSISCWFSWCTNVRLGKCRYILLCGTISCI